MDFYVRPYFTEDHNAGIYDLNKPFIDTLSDAGSIKYVFQGGFEVLDFESDEILATVQGYFFNERTLLNDGMGIDYVADMIDQTTYDSIEQLTQSELYSAEIDDDKAVLSLFNCYIERVFVYPKFRNQGIAKYLFSNLENIVEYCFNAPIRCFVIYPNPQLPTPSASWDNAPDVNGQMKQLMIDTIEKYGFSKLGNSGYYAKNCAI